MYQLYGVKNIKDADIHCELGAQSQIVEVTVLPSLRFIVSTILFDSICFPEHLDASSYQTLSRVE
jgi:hypothetical protein